MFHTFTFRTLSLLAVLGLALLSLAPRLAHAQKPVFTTLHRFDGSLGDAGNGPLAVGPDGTLYGTLDGLGDEYNNMGVVYSFNPSTLTFKKLVTFTDSATQRLGRPTPLFFSALDGMLYGGATDDSNDKSTGGVFRLSTGGAFTDLHNFSGYADDNVQNQDGANPLGPPILASDGNYYGTASRVGFYGVGSLYKITPAGVFSVVYSFDYHTGGNPQGRLTEGADGALYGTMGRAVRDGGIVSDGLYKVTKGGVFTQLHAFKADGSEGEFVGPTLTLGTDGSFYGTTSVGGIDHNGFYTGDGVIFKVTASGRFTVLHKFSKDGHGLGPLGLTRGADGNFYGATGRGGTVDQDDPSGRGTLFVMTPAGQVTTLYKFHTAFDGTGSSGVAFGPDGALYGTAGGGAYGHGTIWKLTLPQ